MSTSEALYQSTSDEDLDGQDDSDDDAMFSDDGYTEMTPSFDEFAMLEALEDPPTSEPQAEAPPQEAYEAMKFQAPLDEEEEVLLRSTPFLQADPHGGNTDPLTWVDDPDHDEWITNRAQEKTKGMDEVLEDEMYGLADDELGIGIRSALRRAKNVAKRAGSTAARTARRTGSAAVRTAKKATGLVKKFVPSRDAGKAKMVKNLNAKLVKEHANYLATADRRRGVKKPVSSYLPAARSWARNKIQQAGLPTSYSSGSQVASDVLGADACGSWWNPASWFRAKVKYVLVNTEGERVAEMTETEYQAYAGTKAAMATQQPGEGEPPPEDGAAPPEEPVPEEPPVEEPPAEDATEGDFASSLTSAFKAGHKAGRGEFETDDAEGDDDMIGKYYRSIKDPLADIEGEFLIDGGGNIVRARELSGDVLGDFVGTRYARDFSEGAAEEAMVEATGDADVGRHLRGGLRHFRNGARKSRFKVKMPPPSPEAAALKQRIKQQVTSGVVSEALVRKWAAARAGAPDGALFESFMKRMRACVAKRGAVISADKSETAGMGDFVGWA